MGHQHLASWLHFQLPPKAGTVELELRPTRVTTSPREHTELVRKSRSMETRARPSPCPSANVRRPVGALRRDRGPAPVESRRENPPLPSSQTGEGGEVSLRASAWAPRTFLTAPRGAELLTSLTPHPDTIAATLSCFLGFAVGPLGPRCVLTGRHPLGARFSPGIQRLPVPLQPP
ncbi:hypothetical protein H920_11530 [Fukomys damarensis]|uniref:Uncharacterized protein n=1 Tax=Fukomys damarensis TaxID=885580 RepID=A0A091D4V6_FUKDA|nr:hypothetical protein H920_11530 [Fukomys damarensis]